MLSWAQGCTQFLFIWGSGQGLPPMPCGSYGVYAGSHCALHLLVAATKCLQ